MFFSNVFGGRGHQPLCSSIPDDDDDNSNNSARYLV